MNRTMAFFALLFQKDFSSFCNQKLQEIDLTQGLLYFIIYIGKHPGCSTGELISALRMDWGHSQRSIDKLTQNGFVCKEKNMQDKRAYHLSLTPKGQNAFSVSHQVFFDWDAITLQELSATEKEQLFQILEKLIHRKGEPAYVRNNEQPDQDRNSDT